MAPPVPIPNTEVKHLIADGSASIGCARVGRCQYYEARVGKPTRASFFFGDIPNATARPFYFVGTVQNYSHIRIKTPEARKAVDVYVQEHPQAIPAFKFPPEDMVF